MRTRLLWTKAEVSFLKENYPLYGCTHCAKALNKTTKAINYKAWQLGLKVKKETLHLLKSKSKLGKKNPAWKGNKVGYSSLHEWVRIRKPKTKFCMHCKIRPPHDLANISGNYERNIYDFEWLCRKCHMKSDGRLNKLISTKHTKYDNLQVKKWLKMHNSGMTYAKISSIIGINKTTVRERIIQMKSWSGR